MCALFVLQVHLLGVGVGDGVGVRVGWCWSCGVVNVGDNACTDGQCTMQCILCLHVLIHEFSASPSIMVIHVLGWMPFLMRVWSVVIKSGGETKRSSSGSLCKAGRRCSEKPAFAQQASGKVHVETWAGCNERLRLKTSQVNEIQTRCAVSSVPSSAFFFHSCATWARQ